MLTSNELLTQLKPGTSIYLDIEDTGRFSNGDRSATFEVKLRIPLEVPFKQLESYREDAKRILDAESKELNPTGIKRLIAALLIETFGDGYFGKSN